MNCRDNVTILNGALIGVVNLIEQLPALPLPDELNSLGETTTDAMFYFLELLVTSSFATNPDDLFLTKPAEDILWNGKFKNEGFISICLKYILFPRLQFWNH